MIAQQRHEDGECGEIADESHQHHVAHGARPGRADEHPVHLEGQCPGDRRQRRPGQVFRRLGPDTFRRRQQADDIGSEDQEKPGGDHAEAKRPDECEFDSPVEGRPEIRSEGAAHELLGRIGDAVEIIAGNEEDVHENRIGRQRQRPHRGADAGHDGEGADQHEGADHDVAVERKQRLQPRRRKDFRPRGPVGAIEARDDDGKADQRTDGFADERAPGDAGNAPAEPEAERDRQHDIDAVDDRLQQEPRHALPAPEHEAEQRIIGERHGGGEHADHEIGRGDLGHFRRRRHQEKPAGKQQRREQHQHEARTERDGERTPVDRLLLAPVAAPESLRHQSRRRGAQEIEAAEQQIEDDGGDGHAGQRIRRAKAPGHRCVRQAEQRRRQEAQRHGNGDRQHQPVRHFEGTGPVVFACRRGAHANSPSGRLYFASIRIGVTGRRRSERTIAAVCVLYLRKCGVARCA